VISTGFALLFLTRATENLTLPKRSGPGTLKTAVATPRSTRIHVILDCSGSMLEEMEGRPKFDIAREAVLALVDALPEQAQFGLRVYGHRKRATEEGASDDTELLVPIGGVKREVLQAKLKELRARGKTPMAKSLLDARGDVRGGTADNPIVVILLTDGGEDSQPRRDPLKAAEEFGAIDGVRLHVVGFDINRPDWLEQLQGMAARARGQYLPAQQSAALQRELKSAVLGTPEGFAILDAQGKPAGAGAFGESKPLPEGKYTFRTEFAGKTFEQPFWINAGAATAVTFDAAMVAREADAQAATPAAPPPAHPAAPADAAPAPAPAGQGNKFCTSCGAKLTPGAKFCTSCGAKQ
jgi:Ca-activated chloride channel family protein